MKIISKQKDYYDGVSAHGMDLDLVYVRDNRSEVMPEKGDGIIHRSPSGHGFASQTHLIGFCGKLYPVVQLWKSTYSNDYKSIREANPAEMYPDLTHIDAFMESHLDAEKLESYYAKPKQKSSSYKYMLPAGRVGWEMFYEGYNEATNKLFASLFDDAKAPVFVVSSNHQEPIGTTKFGSYERTNYKQGIVYNPYLKNYAFAKVKDPYAAFQDIRMWLSNLASPEKKLIEMSNEDTAQRLGHGDKYSFRKAPTKKRK